MGEFFMTRMGQQFFDGTMPRIAKALERIAKALEAEAKPKWEKDHLQFPRLLAELRAEGLTEDQYKALRASMDLDVEEIDELLERAETEWQRIKEADRG